MDRERGKVKFWRGEKGWGYIIRSGKPDIFVHYREIVGNGHKDLVQGAEVEFEERSTPHGIQACVVTIQSIPEMEVKQ